MPNLPPPRIAWALCKLSETESRQCCCMVWLDNLHPIQRLADGVCYSFLRCHSRSWSE